MATKITFRGRTGKKITYRTTEPCPHRYIMFCPVGFKAAGNTAMVSVFGKHGQSTFDKGKPLSDNPPGAATHYGVSGICTDAEKDAMDAADFGQVSVYWVEDGWNWNNALYDAKLSEVDE